MLLGEKKSGADIVFPIPLQNFSLTLSETMNKSPGNHLQNKHACVCILSHVQLFVTSWIVAHQAPLSTGFSRQESPSPGDLPDPGIEPKSPGSPALAGGYFTSSPPGKPKVRVSVSYELEIAPLDKYTKAALHMLTRRQCKDDG